MKVLSQVGVYTGMAIAFLLAFTVFRLFSQVKRSFHAYVKLYALALGFVAPIYGVHEFVTRSVLGGVGMSSFGAQMTPDDWLRPTTWTSVAIVVGALVYFIGIHRRFWDMPVWKAALLYLPTSIVANNIGYQLMWYVGWYSAYILSAAGIVKI
jgi:hypothetical protein